jgi:hypothetical protein
LEKQCSKCQQPFGCKNEAPGCWCESLHVPIEALKELKQQFDNCLCPSCLKQYTVTEEVKGQELPGWNNPGSIY